MVLAITLPQVLLVYEPHALQVLPQGRNHALRQDRAAIFGFAVTNRQLLPPKSLDETMRTHNLLSGQGTTAGKSVGEAGASGFAAPAAHLER